MVVVKPTNSAKMPFLAILNHVFGHKMVMEQNIKKQKYKISYFYMYNRCTVNVFGYGEIRKLRGIRFSSKPKTWYHRLYSGAPTTPAYSMKWSKYHWLAVRLERIPYDHISILTFIVFIFNSNTGIFKLEFSSISKLYDQN